MFYVRVTMASNAQTLYIHLYLHRRKFLAEKNFIK